MSTIIVPQGFSYVAGALLSTVVVLVGQSFTVGRSRRRADIKYPQMYAEKAEAAASFDALKFNCAQRAHQNTLEQIPIIYLLTVLSGLKHPLIAASACGLWSFSRIPYTLGYITGNPAKRSSMGATLMMDAAVIALLGTALYSVVPLILSGV